ncbi:UDP-N-acetylglucosamine pyrophosphorylase [Arthroderma uncinatum]|uniref:UDP-N-acetylglucosamine pyrophosphorylase n=1 Tax=Arthroderma uncinatum TaxID=74035 RepID=UPI00144AE6AA|nr:UDP-N-acetylglucosamine pyrophosphorylase [Arthroderma uncinatum]KAF3492197.1 UDP-N-acetylglucosamine pyrophosphorylase [Arthroderma uncinatum]
MAAAVRDTVSNLIGKISGMGVQDTPLRQPSAEEVAELKKKYEQANQGQVFARFDTLSSNDQAQLFHQLSTFDPEHINKLVKRANADAAAALKTDTPKSLEPLPENATASILDSNPDDLRRWYDEGLKLIAENKVAVVLMAGGQGTRLGSSDPKGCFDIGLPSKKSLFQIQAERIAKLQSLATDVSGNKKVVVPWYTMTSGPTRQATEKFFTDNNFFGLAKENVTIFNQGVLPCISNDGEILLESASKVAVAPDGNGGIYQALITSGVRDDMKKRGIEHIHAYCVDNCLVKVADPTFIGFAASKKVDIATKVVRKRNATESVGLIVLNGGKPGVVEYSEIDQDTANAVDPKQAGVLKFRAANIVNHYYSFSFFESIESWASDLPHHIARKKIPFFDTKTGATVKPESPNGIKLEQFVFDVFPLTPLEKFAAIEVKREEEFSPLKNARGTKDDNPDTSKQDIMQQGLRWIEAAGGIVSKEAGAVGVEVSPSISYGGEGLEFLKGRTVNAPALIEIEEKKA